MGEIEINLNISDEKINEFNLNNDYKKCALNNNDDLENHKDKTLTKTKLELKYYNKINNKFNEHHINYIIDNDRLYNKCK